MLEDKIINNSFDNVDYGTESLKQSGISISAASLERFKAEN